jgi:hypothetical protein
MAHHDSHHVHVLLLYAPEAVTNTKWDKKKMVSTRADTMQEGTLRERQAETETAGVTPDDSMTQTITHQVHHASGCTTAPPKGSNNNNMDLHEDTRGTQPPEPTVWVVAISIFLFLTISQEPSPYYPPLLDYLSAPPPPSLIHSPYVSIATSITAERESREEGKQEESRDETP